MSSSKHLSTSVFIIALSDVGPGWVVFKCKDDLCSQDHCGSNPCRCGCWRIHSGPLPIVCHRHGRVWPLRHPKQLCRSTQSWEHTFEIHQVELLGFTVPWVFAEQTKDVRLSLSAYFVKQHRWFRQNLILCATYSDESLGPLAFYTMFLMAVIPHVYM